MKIYYSIYVLFCSVLAAIVGLLLVSMKVRGGEWCYRGAPQAKIVTHYSGNAVGHYGYGYSAIHGYHKEYVPYAVEVQVNKDRYYSLSDLYRDRIYLEAFDLLREMKGKLNQLKGGEPDRGETSSPAPVNTPPAAASSGTPPSSSQRDPKAPSKTTPEALLVLQGSCVSCHNADTAATKERPNPLRLDDPDGVPTEMRWAAFGRAAVRNMPLAPKNLREEDGPKLAEWRSKNSLSDDALKKLFDGWVVVPPVFK